MVGSKVVEKAVLKAGPWAAAKAAMTVVPLDVKRVALKAGSKVALTVEPSVL